MRQRSPDVERLFGIPGRGALLAVSIGLVALVVACGKPTVEVTPTVTRIASPANAPIIEPTAPPAPTEAATQVTAAATVAETGAATAESGTVVAEAATPEAATAEAGTAVSEETGGSAAGGDYAGLVGDISKGSQLSAQCLACHSVDGSAVIGPTWKGLYGHEVTLTDGSTVTADSEYIAESIRDPNAKVVEGFPAVMPPFTYLSDQDIADLIAYIKSLE